MITGMDPPGGVGDAGGGGGGVGGVGAGGVEIFTKMCKKTKVLLKNEGKW